MATKHIILFSIVLLLVGYFVGIKFPSYGSAALAKIGA